MSLHEERCAPCKKPAPPLTPSEASQLLAEVGGGWQLNAAAHLERDFRFDDFAQALAFANAVGAVAEQEGHHPELTVGWGHCKVEIWTHAISGLSRSDFVLAAKTSKVGERPRGR